jgi:hypothetical protein
MRDLGTLSSTANCSGGASTINATGRIVGFSCTAAGASHAVYWH